MSISVHIYTLAHQFRNEKATNSTQLKFEQPNDTISNSFAGQNKINQPDDQLNSKPYKIQKGNLKMEAYLQCLHKGFEIRDREEDMVASALWEDGSARLEEI